MPCTLNQKESSNACSAGNGCRCSQKRKPHNLKRTDTCTLQDRRNAIMQVFFQKSVLISTRIKSKSSDACRPAIAVLPKKKTKPRRDIPSHSSSQLPVRDSKITSIKTLSRGKSPAAKKAPPTISPYSRQHRLPPKERDLNIFPREPKKKSRSDLNPARGVRGATE